MELRQAMENEANLLPRLPDLERRKARRRMTRIAFRAEDTPAELIEGLEGADYSNLPSLRMKVEAHQCKTPTCRGCGRRMGFEHYEGCPIVERCLTARALVNRAQGLGPTGFDR